MAALLLLQMLPPLLLAAAAHLSHTLQGVTGVEEGSSRLFPESRLEANDEEQQEPRSPSCSAGQKDILFGRAPTSFGGPINLASSTMDPVPVGGSPLWFSMAAGTSFDKDLARFEVWP